MSRRPRSYEAEEYLDMCERVTCPTDAGGCGALPQQPCVNPHTGEPARVPHWQRHRAATRQEPR